MKSNKKHHGHTNPNNKQKQVNKQLNSPNNTPNELSLHANESDHNQQESITKPSIEANKLENQPNQSLPTQDENLPVLSDDQEIADAINEKNASLNASEPLASTNDLATQNQPQASASSTPGEPKKFKPVQISCEATPKKLGIVIIEHNCQTKIKEFMANFSNRS